VSRLRLPPIVYEFYPADPADRSLYVGKDSNPGSRIAAHFRKRESWALDCGWIRVNYVYGAADADDPLVDLLEQQRIADRRPRGNQVHNWDHYDAVWDHRVQRAHRARMGVSQPRWDGVRLAGELVRLRVRWLRQVVTHAVVVNVVVVVCWAATRFV